MVGFIISLVFSLGVYLVWSTFWPIPEVEQRLTRGSTWADRVDEMLVQAGWQRTLSRGRGIRYFLSSCFVLGIVAGTVTFAATAVLGVAVLAAIFALVGPYLLVKMLAQKRMLLRRQVWPDVVDNLRSSIRAGLSLPDAVTQLEVNGPDVLKPNFSMFASEYRVSGRFAQSLDVLKDSFADPVADRIVEALRMARDVGGSELGTLLQALGQFLRDETRTRAELHARQSWTVNAAKLSVAAPWIVLLLMSTRPQSLQAFNSTQGTVVLLAGAFLCFAAYRIMKLIARLPDDERVLR